MKPDDAQETVRIVADKAATFWTRGRALAATATVAVTLAAGLIAWGQWTERMTQAVETIAEDHSDIEQRLDRLAAIVEAHVRTPAHTHQTALNRELRVLAKGANDKVEAYMAADKQTEQRWFRVEWPEHLAIHADIEKRLRATEGKR